jgi:hypothetical protein
MTATPLTTMAELGYSLEAQDVLERMGIHNARELLAVDRIRFRYLRGVGDKIRKEIRLTAKELARLRPDLTQGRSTAHDATRRSAAPSASTSWRRNCCRAAPPVMTGRKKPPSPTTWAWTMRAGRRLAQPGRAAQACRWTGARSPPR